MTYDRVGNLYVCEHVTSSLIVETPAGERKVLAAHWQGRELNSSERRRRAIGRDRTSPIRSTDGCPCSDWSGSGSWTSRALPVSRDGALHREADDFSQPNGLCLSPDEAILYVNDTTRAHIRAFDVAGDGSLRRRRIFAEGVGSGTTTKASWTA